MELNFIKVFDRWVAEFTATEDFNIHIEGVKLGNLSIFQKGTENGGYAFVNGAVPTPSAGTVYDCDFSATIYPKYMKVSCTTEPTLAVVTSGTEVVVNEVVPENLDFKFRVNMEETDSTVNGEVEGNFNGTYNTVAAFAKNYGTVEDYGYSVKDEDTLNKVDMKINSYDVTEVEYHESDEYIKMQTDALASNEADGAAVLRRSSVSFAYALPVEEPESPEMIEYNFWIPNMEKQELLGVWYEGTLEGDFSREFNELVHFVKANGVEEEYSWRYGDDVLPLSNPKVTINGYNATMLVVNKGNGSLEIGTDGPSEALSDSSGVLTDTSIYFNTPIAYNPDAPKPESDLIEYHFEIPMEGHGLLLGGEIYGDFSDTHSKLLSFIRSNGANDEFGLLAVDSETLNKKTNITVNDEKVISMRYDHNNNFIDMGTSAPESTLQVHLTMVTYEKSIL